MTSPYRIEVQRAEDGYATVAVSDDRTIVLAWCPTEASAHAAHAYVLKLAASPATLASLLRALGRDDLADRVGV